ncbi:MAG TPA: putative sulfate exporter family transporter [Bacteroidia bacterium]
MKSQLKGIVFSAFIGTVAIISAQYLPHLGSILLGLLLGMIIGNTFKISADYLPGITYTSSKLLEFSILFLALGINFKHIAEIGAGSFLLLTLVILLILLISIFLARKMKQTSTNYLVGFGTAICGSSAIAAVAPTLSKDKQETAISLAVVNLMGTLGMLLLPLILAALKTSDLRSGFIIGGSLHSVANVAGAGFSMGDEPAKIAITIKLARVALLSPALILYSIIIRKGEVQKLSDHFKLPWYVWSFIGITIMTSFISIPKEVISISENTGKMVLTIAMAAIGLKVSFKSLYHSGKNAMLFGALLFAIQLLLLGISSYFI